MVFASLAIRSDCEVRDVMGRSWVDALALDKARGVPGSQPQTVLM